MDNEKINDEKIDDIVAMLDQFMGENGGHMNITVHTDGSINAEKTVQKTNSLECASGDMACKVPTLFEGMDHETPSRVDRGSPSANNKENQENKEERK